MIDIKLILKGIIIGIGKVVPGVSGSMLAILLKVYDKAIYSICNLRKNIKNEIYFLGNLAIGILIAIVFFSKIIMFFYLNYSFYTILFIIGLLFGSIINFTRSKKPKRKIDYLYIIISFIIPLMFLNSIGVEYHYYNNIINNIYIFFLGVIESFSIFIPGLSGTAIFMLLGVYNFYLKIYSFEIVNASIIFFFGLLIGSILSVRMINYILNKKRNVLNMIVIGLSFSSILVLTLKSLVFISSVNVLFLGSFFLVFGFFLSKCINK